MEKKFYHSKKFWASIVAASIPMLNHYFGWDMEADKVMTIMAPLMAYVFGQGLADLGKNAK